jgi:hypothetical protein
VDDGSSRRRRGRGEVIAVGWDTGACTSSLRQRARWESERCSIERNSSVWGQCGGVGCPVLPSHTGDQPCMSGCEETAMEWPGQREKGSELRNQQASVVDVAICERVPQTCLEDMVTWKGQPCPLFRSHAMLAICEAGRRRFRSQQR